MVFKKTHLADSLTTTAIRIYPTKIFATHPSQKSVGHLRNSQKKSLFHIQLDSYPFVRSVLVLDNDLKGSLINYSRRLYPVFCQKCIFFCFSISCYPSIETDVFWGFSLPQSQYRAFRWKRRKDAKRSSFHWNFFLASPEQK